MGDFLWTMFCFVDEDVTHHQWQRRGDLQKRMYAIEQEALLLKQK